MALMWLGSYMEQEILTLYLNNRLFPNKALDVALTGCDCILNDEFTDYPEQSLYMIGSVDEAINTE